MEQNGTNAQKWRFVAWGNNIGQTVSDGRYHIVSAVDASRNKGLDVANGVKDNGANIQIYDNMIDHNQTFQINYLGNGYYKIINVNSGRSLDVDGAGTKREQTSNNMIMLGLTNNNGLLNNQQMVGLI